MAEKIISNKMPPEGSHLNDIYSIAAKLGAAWQLQDIQHLNGVLAVTLAAHQLKRVEAIGCTKLDGARMLVRGFQGNGRKAAAQEVLCEAHLRKVVKFCYIVLAVSDLWQKDVAF